VLGNVAIFGGLLFLPTRNLSWWRAWLFLGVVLVGAAASTVSVRRASRALLEERFKSPVQEGQPLADKIIVILLIAAFVGVIAFIPLDVFRLHLMARPNRFVSSSGLILFVAGWWGMTLALRANPFAALVVKHQEDRRRVAIAMRGGCGTG
jgi:protein-S-isoprenylcysteine O-methyltransferase Ste14